MKILFLTSNQNKLKEAQDILGDNIQVIGQSLELHEIQAIKAEEIIQHKIAQAKKALKNKKFFVEDTALYLGKNKEIGVLIKFFDNQRVVKAYENEPAEAACLIGLSDGKIFLGKIRGKIVKPKGNHGFGWDPIFQPSGYDKTFAQMTPEEKNNLSMRKIALEKLRRYLLS